MIRIIAIDPGYERLGIAVLEKNNQDQETVVYSDCFKTSKDLPHAERLKLLGDEIERVIKQYSPSSLAIETLYFNSNQKTALSVAEARGVILYKAKSAQLKIYEYTPLQIKIAVTSYGRSDKHQMISMIKRIIRFDKPQAVDDEYDAIAAGITCFATEKFGL